MKAMGIIPGGTDPRFRSRHLPYLLLLICVCIVLIEIASRNLSSYFYASSSLQPMSIPSHPYYYLDQDNEKPDNNCGAWSSSIVILPPNTNNSDLLSYNKSQYPTPRVTWEQSYIMNNSIVQTTWVHERADAPYSATGLIHASIFHLSSNKKSGNVPNYDISDDGSNNNLLTLREKEKILLMCLSHANITTTTLKAEHHNKGSATISDAELTGTTAILNLIDFPYIDEAFPCPNLWHGHAAFYMMWVGLQIAKNIVKSNNNRLLMKPPEWIVALIPSKTWSGVGLDNNLDGDSYYHNVFFPSIDNLRTNVTMDMQPAVQLLSDVFGGRVILAKQEATIDELYTILHQNNAPTNIGLWINPPGPPAGGLMWDIAWDSNLSTQLTDCKHSMLLHYRNSLLNSAVTSSSSINDEAKHICVVSRQERDRRNMAPDFLLKLLGRLGAPVLMTPRQSLRTNTSTTSNGVPILLDKSSITGQMRYVNQECAVLVGVHGAGLTNTLGLRPGTSVIELQSDPLPNDMIFQYFRNVAALMEDVDYTMFIIQPGEEGKGMYTDDMGLQQLVEIIQTKLHDSMTRQAMYK